MRIKTNKKLLIDVDNVLDGIELAAKEPSGKIYGLKLLYGVLLETWEGQLFADMYTDYFPEGTFTPVGQNGIERTPIAKSVRKRLIKDANYTCAYCNRKFKEPDLQIDHIVSVAKGGSSNISNLVVACRTCNISKGMKSVGEWLNG